MSTWQVCSKQKNTAYLFVGSECAAPLRQSAHQLYLASLLFQSCRHGQQTTLLNSRPHESKMRRRSTGTLCGGSNVPVNSVTSCLRQLLAASAACLAKPRSLTCSQTLPLCVSLLSQAHSWRVLNESETHVLGVTPAVAMRCNTSSALATFIVAHSSQQRSA